MNWRWGEIKKFWKFDLEGLVVEFIDRELFLRIGRFFFFKVVFGCIFFKREDCDIDGLVIVTRIYLEIK